jgi:hypothetical protein
VGAVKKLPWQTYRLHECERCGGDLCVDEDQFGRYSHCLQCGALWAEENVEEETEPMLQSDKVIPGCNVWSKDGAHLGKVEAVSIGAFEVKPDRGRVYWIADDFVFNTQDFDVILALPSSDLASHKLPSPSART